MKFRWDIRNQIKDSDLFYLNPWKRRQILSKATSLNTEDINRQISHIFKWHDLQENWDHALIWHDNLIIISSLCSNYEELIWLIFNNRVDVFLSIDSSILRRFVMISKTRKNFIEICSHEIVFEVLFQNKVWNLFNILRILDSKEELFGLLENPDFIYFITKWKDSNISFILDYLNINNKTQLLELLNDKRWEHIKKLLKNWTSIDIKRLLFTQKNEQSIVVPPNTISFSKDLVIWTCWDVEEFNKRILSSAKIWSYIEVTYQWKIVWYIKQVNVPSFLALRNVYSNDGILLLKAWMIYALLHAEDTFTPIELNDNNWICINPIRMLNLNHLDELIADFLSKVS